MVMPAPHTEWTVEMLDALPDDGQRCELIDGELFVTPAPSDDHQLVVGALGARLRAYYQTKRELYLGNGIPEYWVLARWLARPLAGAASLIQASC